MSTTPLTVSFPTEELLASFPPLPEGVEPIVWDLGADAERASIDLVLLPFGRPDIHRRLEGVRTQLVQTQAIGWDHLADVIPAGHRLANGATIQETATAELTLALVLAGQRDLAWHLGNQQRGHWGARSAPGLADRRVLILGYGGLGFEIERRLGAFDVAEVVRVARSAKTHRGLEVHGLDRLHELLAEVDVLIVTAALNPSSVGLVDADVLAALPDGALVVNVARGRVVDQAALLAELTAGRLRAALDVTDPEPLPAEHPLWRAPGLIITPHVGGDTAALAPRREALYLRQIGHLLAGREPENVVLDRR